MKQMKKSTLLPLVAIGGGVLGLLLRLWLQHSGVDDSGLLISGHPSVWLLNLVCVADAVALLLLTRSAGDPGKYYDNFPDFAPAGITAFLAAAGLFLVILWDLIQRPDALTALCDLVGLMAVFSLAFTGYCRLCHRRPAFHFHAILCVYLILRLICRYRSWSSDPQLQNYAYELLANVCLMLLAYHRTAFDLNQGSRRSMQFWGLTAVSLCIICLAGTDSWLFYCVMGLWTVTNLCVLDPLPRKPEAEPAAEPQTENPDPPAPDDSGENI